MESEEVLSTGFLPIISTQRQHIIMLVTVVVHDVGNGVAADVDILQQRLQIRRSH